MKTAMQCPITNKPWELLLKSVDGDGNRAMDIYIANQGYPQSILNELAKKDIVETQPNPELEEVDKHLKQKNDFLEKARGDLKRKLQRLSHVVKKNPDLKERVRELKKTLKELDDFEADYAINKYLIHAQTTTNSLVKHMKNLKQRVNVEERELNLEELVRIREHLKSLNLLDELSEDFAGDEKLKKEFEIIHTINESRTKLQRDSIDLTREYHVKTWSPYFDKVKAYYKDKATREFIMNKKPELRKQRISSTELDKKQKEYVEAYMMIHADKISYETEEYVRGILKKTVDMSTAVTYAVNPRDMGHDIMSMAVEALDTADYAIDQKTIAKEEEADEIYKRFEAYVGKSGNPEKQFASIFAVDEEGKSLNVVVNQKSLNWTEFRETYAGTPVWEMQQFISKLVKEKDAIVPIKLGFALPRVNKNNLERMYTSGAISTAVEGFKDKFKLRADDTEFGDIEGRIARNKEASFVEVITGPSGNEREVIPLHYRNTNVAPEDQSKDVLSLMLMDYHNSLNFEAKSETAVFLQSLQDLVSEADIEQRTSFKQILKVDRTTGEALTKKAKEAGSNLALALNSLIRHRVYGIQTEGDPRIAKVLNSIRSYTSMVALAGKGLTGMANVLHGSTVSWIETAGKNTGVFGIKNRAHGTAEYYKEMANGKIVADIGQRVPKSRTNLLARKFDAMSDHQPLDKKFNENTRIKRIAQTGSLIAFNTMGEHNVQSIVMYSVLDNIKVKDANGDFLDKDFKPTKDREKAIGVDTAHVKDENGKLDFHPAVVSTEKTSGIGFSDMRIISKLIRRTNRDLYGNYDSKNKSILKRSAVGALTYQMRGWLIPGVQKRFRGIGRMSINPQDKDLAIRSFNPETGEFEEGTYTETMRFVYNIGKDLLALKLATAPQYWNTLTDEQKARIKRATLEITVAVIMWLASKAFKEGDDPEDLYAAYLSRKLYSELTSFINPSEAVRTFRNPVMSLNSVQESLDFLAQTVNPTERYKSGRRSGELKIKKRFADLVPIWNAWDSNVEDALAFLENG
jgi:hypothetical protein